MLEQLVVTSLSWHAAVEKYVKPYVQSKQTKFC